MIHFFSEFVACLLAVLTFSKLDTFSRIIALQVCIAFVVEFAGWQMTQSEQKNGWLYNLYMPIEFSLLFLATSLFYKSRIRYGMIILLIFYWLFWTVEIFNNSIENFAVKTYVIGAFILVIGYFFVLNKSTRSRSSLLSQRNFWFAIGIILFFFCIIPLFSMYDYIVVNSNKFQMYLLSNLMKVFYHFRYLCTAIGFIIVFREVKKKQKNIANGE